MTVVTNLGAMNQQDPIELAKARVTSKPVVPATQVPPSETPGVPNNQPTKGVDPLQGLAPIEPLSVTEIAKLFGGPMPNKEALDQLKNSGTPEGERVKELEKVKAEGQIDYSNVRFVDDKVFESVIAEPEALNKFMQQFAQYIVGDVAEKIAFVQKSQENYANAASAKLMSDMGASQIIRDFLARPENSPLLSFQDYFLFKLGNNRANDGNARDLHQLLQDTAKEVKSKFNITSGNQNASVPGFGGLGTAGSPGETPVKDGSTWKAVITDLLHKNR